MGHPKSITLYTAKICPYAQRVEIALAEAKVEYKAYQVDLSNKPEWFAPKVNPASKVPAIAYGGPDVDPESPSSESTKLAESLVLVEFIADLYPEANLLPKDPTLRAKARFFVEVVNSKFLPMRFILHNEPYQSILDTATVIQSLLPESGKYAMGDEYTIADIAFTPFYARFKLSVENEIGAYEYGKGREILNALQAPKYAKFNAYVDRLLERPSFKATFDEVKLTTKTIYRGC
ncbi:hypothetical protein HYDPIDRAFT_93282 [Hydnomerulius pinastri MD-312]|uniref:Glutathione transferase n=1 Tax=Hydnomerulius pinastri MD-312 TaxID=994086 RepID=A0A0C9WDI6_9AGAM|nr:hypothetical protein HYDPIDRAFT_93282 [Hydnomerulius pinastri MD-312]